MIKVQGKIARPGERGRGALTLSASAPYTSKAMLIGLTITTIKTTMRTKTRVAGGVLAQVAQ